MNPDEMDNMTTEEPTPGDSTTSDVTVGISADVESIPEGNDGDIATVTYTITASEPLDRDARVIVESTGGNNPLVSEPLDIPAGQQSVTFTNEVNGDSVPEENETLTGTVRFAAFNAPDGSTGEEIAITQPTATVTVTDDDTISEMSIADAAIVEGNEGSTSLEFTVSLSQPVEEEVTVDYGVVDDTAVAGEDYITTEGSLSFAPGETSQVINVEIVGDASVEEDETFFVELRNAEGVAIADLDAIGTITNDDGDTTTPPSGDLPNLSISADAESVPEGNEGDTTTVTFTVDLDRSFDRDVVVNANISQIVGGDPNTTAAQSINVLIPTGEESGQLTYQLLGDNNVEPDGTITASFNNVSFVDSNGNITGDAEVDVAQSTATVTVTDDDGGTTDGSTNDDENDIVYRFFNPTAGVHFYTDDENERDFVENELDNYQFEGSSYRTVAPLSEGAEDVYRFFNSRTGVHLYTTDENERDSIIENLDEFSFEGTVFNAYETQVEGSIPVYRFFEPTIGVHFYTPSEAERDVVDAELDNYNNEGIAYYALPLDAEIL